MNTTNPKISRLRAIVTSKPIIIGLGLLGLYALIGFLLAPWLIQKQLPALAEQHLDANASVGTVRINPFLLTLEATDLEVTEKNGAPTLKIGRLFVDFEADSLLQRAWTFRQIEIDRPVIAADLNAKQSLNLARLFSPKPAAKPAPAAEPSQLPRFLLRNFVLTEGTLTYADHTVQPAARAQFNPVRFEVHDVSTLPDQSGKHTLTARLPGGGSMQWQGKFTLAPIASDGAITLQGAKLATLWQFARDQLGIAEPDGSYDLNLRYRVRRDRGAIALQADELSFRLKDVALALQGSATPLGKFSLLALEGGSFDMKQRTLAFKDAHLAESTINLNLDEHGKPDWAGLVRTTKSDAGSTTAAAAATSKPWQITLPKVRLGSLALNMKDDSRVKPVHTTIAAAQADFSLTATIGNDTQVQVDDFKATLGKISIRSSDDTEPPISLASLELAGGAFNLQQKSVRATLLKLSGGNVVLVRDANGKFRLFSTFDARNPQPKSDSGYSVELDRAELDGYSVSMTDQSYKPSLTYDFDEVRLSMADITFPFKKPSPVELELKVLQGGALKARGVIDLLQLTADVRFEATDVALTPLQTIIKRYTTLTLASGKARAGGRVTWNGKSNPAAIVYAGSAALADIDLKSESPAERLISWQSLAATDINFSAAENRLAIAKLNLARPYTKLVINKDRSTNFSDIMRPRPPPVKPAPAATSSLDIKLDRISIDRGAMDFSDFSLVLPFSTPIKALSGVINGLASSGATPAGLKFEGRVSEFGLARAEGTIQPFAPKKFTDVTVTFRNVSLPQLSPYTATFAGRNIAEGKMSLDLEYKLDNGSLAGENKVMLEKLVLGERVESPTALDLPLDLAIALLTDSDGNINLTVPVSGDVNSPKFDYGQVISTAISSAIGGIITAPFRALGAIFGGSNAETLGDIVFDPGSARILPTEYEKLRRVSDGLQKRPQLKLIVQGQYHSENDSQSLREQMVRTDLTVHEGLKLNPGEDPGPVGYSSPRTQRALETMYIEKTNGAAIVLFVDAFRKNSGSEANRVHPLLAAAAGGAGDPALYEAMHQALIKQQSLSPTALPELAQARATAIINAFVKYLKLEPKRLGDKPAEATETMASNGVPAKLTFVPMN